MAERYTRLFTLPPDLYTAGSPLVIAAGALLKDTQTGRVLAQLKLRSISDQRIRAVKLRVVGYDVSQTILCREEHEYLDLDIRYTALTAENIALLKSKGIKVNCWTVDDPAAAAQLIEWGVDFITSNILE